MSYTKGNFKDGYKGWKVEKDDFDDDHNEYYDIISADDESYDFICGTSEIDNANLISAAPEMYEALKEILKKLESLDEDGYTDDNLGLAWEYNLIKDAIDKAEGENE